MRSEDVLRLYGWPYDAGFREAQRFREQNDATPPYSFVGKFAYSLRCQKCRDEADHTQEEHNTLRVATEPK